jgi:hypothetical protein
VPGNSTPPAAPRPPAPSAPQQQAPTPSDNQTRAMPVQTNRDTNGDPAEPTTALPVMRTPGNDSDAATEKLNARAKPENGEDPRPRRRAGGGLSAQDLLRREGRL